MNIDRTELKSAAAFILEEHEEMKSGLKLIEKSNSNSRREEFLAMVKLVVTHEQAEEEIIYPFLLLQKKSLESQLQESTEEHHLSDLLMEEIRSLPISDPRWSPKVEVLRESLEHHVEEEEETLIPLLKNSQTDALCQAFYSRLTELRKNFKRDFKETDAVAERETPLFIKD